MRKHSSRLLGVVSAVVILSSAAAYSSDGCREYWIGDGFCHLQNNNAECGYDGGDCCECTCEIHSTDYYSRGCNPLYFACIDPDASCVDDDDVTAEMAENCEWVIGIGNGNCEEGNNKAECGYDGGDCCECTCVSPSGDSDYYCSKDGSGFACIDPDAPCVDDDDITANMVGNCETDWLGDGYCDQSNNNEICGYDGGDCCECTCVNPWGDDDDWRCSADGSGFACIDPAASCVGNDDITAVMVENCGYVRRVGDGWCNEENNNELCAYDGGDCCECTCEAPPSGDDWYTDDGYGACGSGFACIDPHAACIDDDDITVDIDESCDTVYMGDAHCDMSNNNEACAYDGGDCCECTCEDTPNYKCGRWSGFACIDPEAPCVDDDSFTADMLENCERPSHVGDGYCNQGNNNELCGYDGGDCCECTCETPPDDDGACEYQFACIDPNARCVDDDSITFDIVENCHETQGIGNGYCSTRLNTPECAYDGGDCCSCTCQNDLDDDWGCRTFACIDPEAACVNDDDITTDMFEICSDPLDIGDGRCNQGNNNEACGYDGGDCCECTCENDHDDNYRCMEFSCIDPKAACVNDDDITVDMFENCGYVSGIGNGRCDRNNNKVECGYDGGDCCSCTCQSVSDDYDSCTTEYTSFDCKDPGASCFGEGTTGSDDFSFHDDDQPMSYEFVTWEETEILPMVDGAVEVGTKTEVGVSATAHDVRPGSSSGGVGCGEVGGLGCTATKTRDGIFSDIESRWSCSTSLMPDEGPCQIEFTFAETQNIVDIQVAFWKSNERVRTLEVHVNGELTHTHESYSDSTFNALGVAATEANTVMLESVALLSDEWISLVEVSV
ncbi:unnamed protein product, partial [Ectocarpus fasciculatus]